MKLVRINVKSKKKYVFKDEDGYCNSYTIDDVKNSKLLKDLKIGSEYEFLFGVNNNGLITGFREIITENK